MSKQDRQGVRTPGDIERKYNFGKTFDEVFGIANEANVKAINAQNTADSAVAAVGSMETVVLQDSNRIEALASKVSIVEGNVESANDSIVELTEAVSAKMDAQGVEIIVHDALDDGVNKVVTNIGFRFDDEGLNVSKTGSEMETQITEDGMKVYKNDEVTLNANNQGVEAKNLNATTYLGVGGRIRFENYGTNMVGLFWTGG